MYKFEQERPWILDSVSWENEAILRKLKYLDRLFKPFWENWNIFIVDSSCAVVPLGISINGFLKDQQFSKFSLSTHILSLTRMNENPFHDRE